MNEIKRRCIYCGSDKDLSKSDIIPDALTNARIYNNNVCRVEHNNRFSDLFESKVIKALAFITNELDIKSSKGKKYAKYQATVNIKGIDFPTHMSSKQELLRGKVLKSADNKYMMSSLEKVKKISKDKDQISEVDINDLISELKVDINLEIFFDHSMFRLVSKIAYEWYCAKNNVSDYHDDFKTIVEYITKGTDDQIVSIVQNPGIYTLCTDQLNLGSHSLLAFQDNDNKINVIVNLFGIIMYRVIVCYHTPNFCSNNCIYQELCTDSSRKELIINSTTDLKNKIKQYCKNSDNFIPIKRGETTFMVAKENSEIDVSQSIYICNLIDYFLNIYDETTTSNSHIINILHSNIQSITQNCLLHKKSIKRFVAENPEIFNDNIKINCKTINKKSVFMLYVLFTIGKSSIHKLDDQNLQKLMIKALNIKANREIKMTDELEKVLKEEMISTKNYSKYIQRGAKLVIDFN